MKKLFLFLALVFVAFTGNTQNISVQNNSRGLSSSNLKGDMNDDGLLDVTDIMIIVDKILSNENTSAEQQSYLTCPDDHHPHMIDLGLSSGTKWACCNVGANKPEAYGGYYAWGETKEKEVYNHVNYLYYSGDDNDGDGWYDQNVQYQDIGSDIAGTEYDVAHVKWGGSWVMPSFDQIVELVNSCTSEPSSLNGVYGRLFTGPNGGVIFMPHAGRYSGSFIYGVGNGGVGNYWSGMHNNSIDNRAIVLYFNNQEVYRYSSEQFEGNTVRPVCVINTPQPLSLSMSSVELNIGETAIVEITAGNGSYQVSCSATNVATASLSGNAITITGVAPGTAVVKVTDTATDKSQDISVTVTKKQSYLTCPDDHHPHLIDLGLPSGTKWACCNVGAASPEAYGGYYSWGETEEKDLYNDVTYQYATGDDNDGDGWYDDYHSETGFSGVWQALEDDIAGTQYDVAYVKWGGSWGMPNLNQVKELIETCTYECSSLNGISGGWFKGPNGGMIFLPSAGYRKGDGLSHAESYGDYWSSTPIPSSSGNAYCLYFNTGEAGWNSFYRGNGRSVRPIYR